MKWIAGAVVLLFVATAVQVKAWITFRSNLDECNEYIGTLHNQQLQLMDSLDILRIEVEQSRQVAERLTDALKHHEHDQQIAIAEVAPSTVPAVSVSEALPQTHRIPVPDWDKLPKPDAQYSTYEELTELEQAAVPHTSSVVLRLNDGSLQFLAMRQYDGSVSYNRDDLRIAQQLVEVSADMELWKESFARKLVADSTLKHYLEYEEAKMERYGQGRCKIIRVDDGFVLVPTELLDAEPEYKHFLEDRDRIAKQLHQTQTTVATGRVRPKKD